MSWLVLLETAPEIDPNIVKPGWTPLLVTGLLLLALTFLYFSLQKQIRKIHVPDDDVRADLDDEAPAAPTATPPPSDQPTAAQEDNRRRVQPPG